MAALAASEAKFRALSEQSPLGVFHTDAGGRCTYANPRWCEIYGLGAEQALGTGWMARLHPSDRLAVAAAWEASAANAQSFDREFRLQHADGSVRHVHARSAPLFDTLGDLAGFVGVVEDVTDRLLMEQRLRESEAFLDRANRMGGLGGWDFHLADGRANWSAQTRRIHEVEDDFVPTPDAGMQFFPSDVRPLIERAFRGAVERGEGYSLELPMLTARGRRIWVQATGEADLDAEGRPVRVVGTLRDITLRKELELKLAREHELLAVTLDAISDAVLSTDTDGRIAWMNPAAERLLGWSDEDARGREVEQVLVMLDEASRTPAEDPLRACLRLGEPVSTGEGHLLVTRDGRELAVEDSASPIRDADGSLRGAVMVFRDVSEQRRLNREMSYRARHDALTGLANRSEFEARLHEALDGAQQVGQVHALLFIDLDQFKLVNDACGHAAGDELLRHVSRLIEGSIRSGDLLARLGGDEFAVILRHCRGDHAHRVAQQICERMEQFRFHHDGRRFRVGASIGLVPITEEWTSTAAVLQAADTCCYAAKEAGRNRVHAWMHSDEGMRARRDSMRWASRLESALDENRFELHFQRIEPVGRERQDEGHIELLIRLREDGELIGPGAFLPAAERFGLASRIDRWVLAEALRWMQGRDELPRTLAINLSGQSIGDRAFHRFASNLLRDSGAPLQRLCFEITETAAITALQDAASFIAEMRRLGVRIALDDFGAGASSFGYLKQLPVDYLKIDGQFVRNLVNDRFDQVTVACFCQIAAELGIGTIAEFVENAETLDALQGLGVDQAQGYLLHRPQPLVEWSVERLAD